MSTTFKFYLFAFTVPLILFSCTVSQRDMAATPEYSASLATLTPVPIAVNTTASPKLVPKQKDLIFVEFFAVT